MRASSAARSPFAFASGDHVRVENNQLLPEAKAGGDQSMGRPGMSDQFTNAFVLPGMGQNSDLSGNPCWPAWKLMRLRPGPG